MSIGCNILVIYGNANNKLLATKLICNRQVDQKQTKTKKRNCKKRTLLTKKHQCDRLIIVMYKERCAVLETNKIKGVYKRNDGRWEARYVKGYSEKGRAVYGAVYGQSKEEVIAKRNALFPLNGNALPKMSGMNLLILGAGSHGQSIKEIAESLRVFQKIAFLDDEVIGEDIVGKCTDALELKDEYPCAFVAIGDNELRKKYATYLKECRFLIPNIISPVATISKDAKIGEGVAIMPQCTVNNAEIGDFCILASNSLVNYGCKIGDYSRIDCGGIVMRGCSVKSGTLVVSGEVIG